MGMCGLISMSAVEALSNERNNNASALGENCSILPGNRTSVAVVCCRKAAMQGSIESPVLPPTKMIFTSWRYGNSLV